MNDYFLLVNPVTLENSHQKDNTQDLVLLKNLILVLGYTGTFHTSL